MAYNIEVSFSVFKRNTLSNWIKNTAYEFGCSSFQEDYEMDIERSQCVLRIQFDNQENDNDISYFLSFIKNIKKIPNVHIESIYTSDLDTEVNILYASSYYLTIMDKHIALMYRLNRRKRSYSEDDSKIVELFNRE
jgi:hypothetical protein